MQFTVQLAPEHVQALQQLAQSGNVTFTVPPELLNVLLKVLQTVGTTFVQELVKQLQNLNLGPLTPLLVSVVNTIANYLLSLLNNVVPTPPAPTPAPAGGPAVDVG